MTNDQKQAITKMRLQGMGYLAIAKVLGLAKSSVSSYCKRNALNGNRSNHENKGSDEHFCAHCGKPFQQNPKQKKKRFCSDQCRMNWWNAHADKVNRKAIYSYTCAYCGKTFTAYGNAHRKYCSHACYVADRFGGDQHE